MSASITFDVDDDQQAIKLAALFDALGYRWRRAPGRTEARIAEMAEDLIDSVEAAVGVAIENSDDLVAAMHAMLVTDGPRDLARMLGVERGRAKWLEYQVLDALGCRGRVDLLRRVAGIDRAEVVP